MNSKIEGPKTKDVGCSTVDGMPVLFTLSQGLWALGIGAGCSHICTIQCPV